MQCHLIGLSLGRKKRESINTNSYTKDSIALDETVRDSTELLPSNVSVSNTKSKREVSGNFRFY